MGPIWYRMRSAARTAWTTAAIAAVAISVVGALVLALAAGVTRTASAPERYRATAGDADDVAIEQYDGQPRLDEVASLPAVASVDMATFVFAGLVPAGTTAPVEALVFAGSHSAFGARVVAGRAPGRDTPGEFVATRSWLSRAEAQIGDRFRLVTITPEQAAERGFDVPAPGGPTVPATLVGVIDGPSELQDPTPIALFGSGLIEAGDVGVASTIGVVALQPTATRDDLRRQLDGLPAGAVFGLDDVDWVPDEVAAAVDAQAQGLAVVAAIVAVAAVAVLGQLLSRQLRLAPTLLRALAALGLTHRQVVADRLCSVAPSVAVGAVVAAVLSYRASAVFPMGFARRVEPSPGPLFDPIVHVGGAILLAALVLATVLTALLVADRRSRPPRRAGLAGLLGGTLRPGPAVTGIRFGLTRHPDDPGSVWAPVIGLVVVLGALVAALTFGASVDRFLDEPARYGSNFDFATGVGGDGVPEELRVLLQQDPAVSDVTFFGTSLASVGSTALDVTGMQALRGTLGPDVLSGRLALTADEIALGRVAARQLGVEVDEDLVVVGARGAASFRVTGLVVVPSVEGGDGVGEGAVVTLAGLRRLDPDAALGVAAVRLDPGAVGFAERINRTMGISAGLPDPPAAVVNIERVRSTPFIVAGSLALLVLSSMVHQLIGSARRRRRDVAVIRVLGAGGRWATGIVHSQVTAVAVAVAVCAVPLGVAAGRLAYQAYIGRIGARTDIAVPYLVLLVVVVGLVVIANVAALTTGRRVRVETLASLLADE